MTKQNILLTLLALFFSSVYAQQVADTLYTSHGTILLYDNKQWQYLEDMHFDGVMNEHLHCTIEEHNELNLHQHWHTHTTFTARNNNDISTLNDTVWMCVLDDINKDFVMPVSGAVTSRYGYRGRRHHNGIDLRLNVGDTVVAAWSGKVRYAQYNEGGFGNLVIVRHDNGLETFYAHLSELIVAPNQVVKAGQALGLGGNTGRSFGPHLHFEVRFYDLPINPEEVIDFELGECKDDNLLIHRNLFRSNSKPTNEIAKNSLPGNTTKKYYTVRSGDTLYSIARKNGTTVSKLCQLNKIRETTVLHIGKNLRVK